MEHSFGCSQIIKNRMKYSKNVSTMPTQNADSLFHDVASIALICLLAVNFVKGIAASALVAVLFEKTEKTRQQLFVCWKFRACCL